MLESYRELNSSAVKLLKPVTAYFCIIPDGKLKASFAKVEGRQKFAMNDTEYIVLCESQGKP